MELLAELPFLKELLFPYVQGIKPGGSFFGARFGGVGVGVLLEPCDSSDDDDGDDTASDVCIRCCIITIIII